ncbi:MAG: hypothetical protein RMZ69_25925 [Nostoc sp. ChiQUE01a]|nr:hypothetical protein [Nostoc sp. ChiQUE01a]
MSEAINPNRRYFLTTMIKTIAATQLGMFDCTKQYATSATAELSIEGELPSLVGAIAYRFHARDLHLVMGPVERGKSVRFRVLVDGQLAVTDRGLDVDVRGEGTATEQRLYQLVRQPQSISDRQFEIEFLDFGVEAFAFTFG